MGWLGMPASRTRRTRMSARYWIGCLAYRRLVPANLGLLLDAEQSPWNPHWFNYGSFSLYVLKFVQILGGPFLDDPNDIRVLGRAVSGIADVATILAVYGIAALAFERRTGLLAAALTALAVIHIQLSHFFAVDTLQAMLAIAALYFMIRVAREGRTRDSLISRARWWGLDLRRRRANCR